jgi:hypothetical protein
MAVRWKVAAVSRASQPCRQVRYPRVQPVAIDPPGQFLVPVPVPALQRGVLARLLQAFLAVFAQGFRQPVPGRALAVGGDQDRLIGQRGQQLQHLFSGQPVIRADTLGRIELKPAGEHGQPGPQQPLGLAAQLITPLDRGPQCLLPDRLGTAAPGQQADMPTSKHKASVIDMPADQADSIAPGQAPQPSIWPLRAQGQGAYPLR